MARRKAEANDQGQPRGYKSAAVRELLNQNPKMKVRDIISTLAANGIDVGKNHVYFVKSKFGARRRKAKRQQAVQTAKTAGIINPVELVRKVKELAVSAGGLNQLKRLVDLLAE